MGNTAPLPHPTSTLGPDIATGLILTQPYEWVLSASLHFKWHQGKEMPPILKVFHVKTKSTTSSSGLIFKTLPQYQQCSKVNDRTKEIPSYSTSIWQGGQLRLLSQFRRIKSETWTHHHLFQPQIPHFSNWQPHPVRCLVQKCQDLSLLHGVDTEGSS